MKPYQIKQNLIEIYEPFDIFATIFSGQVFRVYNLEKSKYYLISEDKIAIFDIDSCSKIVTNYPNYFVKYFNLDNSNIKKINAINIDYVKEAINGHLELKILHQSKFETLINFIMSANNNIKRFSKTLTLISEKYGTKCVFNDFEYYAFPTLKQLSCATENELKSLGCGYRAKYIVETCKTLLSGWDINKINNLPTEQANKTLCELMGVGEKVADCILLFAYQKYDAFPVDTWIEKVYYENFNGKLKNRKDIKKYFMNIFGDYAGIVQQYLFYYKRKK